MRRAKKKESNSRSSKLGNRKGGKSKSSLSKSSLKKRSLIKGAGKGTKRRTSLSPNRVMQQGRRDISKAKSLKPSLGVRATRKTSVQNTRGSSRIRRSPSKKQTSKRGTNKKIIRVLGHGQFSVDSETLGKLNAIDNSIVRRIEKGNMTDEEFKMKIEQLGEIVTKKGKLLDPKVIVSSDIILPGRDLTIEEASKIFHGAGIIPSLE